MPRPTLPRLLAASLALGLAGPALAQTTVTVLHNNDGESQLISAGDDELAAYGGAARFISVLDRARATFDNTVLISSGDNFIPSPEFTASLNDGVFYDARLINRAGYDAITLGNHEFDFGPDLLADFIPAVDAGTPFLGANFDFSGEPRLQQLADAGRIVDSTVVNLPGGDRVGIVGGATDRLPSVTSSRNVRVSDPAPAIQAAIDALEAQGVNKIILSTHLQSINEEIELVGQLRGVDVVIAGGGDELLANPSDPLLPTDDIADALPYPVVTQTDTGAPITNADGRTVPIVTTPGEYRYLGALEVQFDADGNVVATQGGPLVVADQSVEPVVGVQPDAGVQADVVDPVAAFVAALDRNIIARTETPLNGVRGDIRTQRTDYGTLIAQALTWTAQQQADEFGVPLADIGIANGGGIRNNTILTGNLSELDTFDTLPFSNFVTLVENVPADQLKALLENAVSEVENVQGKFAQVAGFDYEFTTEQDPGNRIISITLKDGTPIVVDGEVVSDKTFNIATVDFLARGGDDYDFGTDEFTALGLSYQQALANYLSVALDGQITQARIEAGLAGLPGTPGTPGNVIPTPSAVLAGLLGLGLAATRRGRMTS